MKLRQSKWSKKEESKIYWVEKDDTRGDRHGPNVCGLTEYSGELVHILPYGQEKTNAKF